MSFLFNDTATTEIYTLSLHDALPICRRRRLQQGAHGHRARPLAGARARGHLVQADAARERPGQPQGDVRQGERLPVAARPEADRKSTRLNSSHANISYAVFCLKKKPT